jgi:hypothetical protein
MPCRTRPSHPTPPDTIILTMFDVEYKFRSFSMCTFLHSLEYSHPLGSNILLSILRSNPVHLFPPYGDGMESYFKQATAVWHVGVPELSQIIKNKLIKNSV